MLPVRTLIRSTSLQASRTARGSRASHARFQSSSSSSSKNAGSSNSQYFAAGIAGGVAAATVLYGTYLLTPSGQVQRKINKGVREASNKYEEASKKLQGSTPNVDEALNYIREFCYSYVGWVPGGRQYVDAAFKDVETLRQKHRNEVNQTISDAYSQFQDLSRSGLSMDTVSKAYEILTDLSKKLGSLGSDAAMDILDNHPQIKQRFGGSIDHLKQMGEDYGPEAKKQVDQTWEQVKEIMGGGISAGNLDKVRRLIQEKVDQVKKLGDEAWKKGLEQAKPYLEKNPKVKELIEKNEDALKQGNATELFKRAKSAVETGDMGEFKDYVDHAIEKTKSKGSKLSGGLDQYLNMIPNGSEIFDKVNELKKVAENHKDEGEKLLKETMEELKQVLEKRSQKAKEIVEKAKKESK
ncbi:hypothetical protein F5B20DRAFT_585296 [Whalleya microplaca]|nr:hypothetical protein F5B20DRAFT_585296 [Whalleya microplaca]